MIGYVTSAFKSVTGWEKSHFGGYNRMITDHPYISLDWQIEIMLSKQLKDELTVFTAEKLIKLYLFKMKQFGISFDRLRTAVEKETHPFTGRQITYQKIFLDDTHIMNLILDGSGEYAPLFKHFEKGILDTYLRKEIPDEEELEKDAKTISSVEFKSNVKSLGFKLKSDGEDLDSGGELNGTFLGIVLELLKDYKEIEPNANIYITSGNDNFHHNLEYESLHTKGRALDLTLGGQFHPGFKKLMDTYKDLYSGFGYIDEYLDPSDASTGPHFHLQFKG
jgi:hypothetical protein